MKLIETTVRRGSQTFNIIKDVSAEKVLVIGLYQVGGNVTSEQSNQRKEEIINDHKEYLKSKREKTLTRPMSVLEAQELRA
ncbi:MAG: hypothetical protein GY909_15150 [Oligoflexia bacterium]|nr:hypothetical protein [Oligoflexia bacterium]